MDIAEAIPAQIAAKMALTQQRVAVAVLKQSVEAQQQIANVLLDGAAGISAATRGQRVNIAA